MQTKDYGSRFCIIGAGPAGVTAAKNLKAQSIPFDLIEREDDIGGHWYYGKASSCVYKSLHMVSSKRFSEFTDFPIPDDYPTYLRADQALTYIRSYAHKFGIYGHAEFGRSVLEIAPVEGSTHWDVTLDGGEVRRYQGIVVANGHLSKANMPDYPGTFDGLQLHSSQYKTPDVLAGKRVLVVGAGNSSCDITVDAAHHSQAVFLSTRRGYYYLPKFLFGKPADAVGERSLRLGVPVWVRRILGRIVIPKFSAGMAEQYGLPKPDHKVYERQFIVNSTLLYHLGHGDITVKREVRELLGDRVSFADGSEEKVDVIVYATGFRPSFPFVDPRHLTGQNGCPQMHMNIFDAKHQNLFFIGLFTTTTGTWPMMDYQAQLLARYLYARQVAPHKAAQLRRFAELDQGDERGGVRFADAARRSIQLEHFPYRRKLQRLIRALPAQGVTETNTLFERFIRLFSASLKPGNEY